MDKSIVFVRAVLARSLSAIAIDWRMVIALVAIDAIPQLLLELAPGDWSMLSGFLSLVTMYLQLLIVFRVLDRAGRAPAGVSSGRLTDGRYPSAFGLNLLTTLGVIVATLLLIVPGIALFAVWSVALPALCAEKLGICGAMRRSWKIVRPRFGGHFLLSVLILLLWLISILALGSAYGDPEIEWTLLTISANCFISAILIIGPVVWTSAYLVSVEEEKQVGDSKGVVTT